MSKKALLVLEGAEAEHASISRPTEILRDHSFKTMLVNNYEVPNISWENDKYDVVILDQDNGPQVAKSIKEMALQTVVIGIIPEDGDLERIEHDYNEAAANILKKPLSVEQIESVLKNAESINRVDGDDVDDYPDDGGNLDVDDSLVHADEPWVTEDVHAPESPGFDESQHVSVHDISNHQTIKGVLMQLDTKESQSNTSNKMALILAETNEIDYMSLFRELGYSVRCVRYAYEAYNLCEDDPFAVVLLDTEIGPEVSETILKQSKAKPVIIGIVADMDALKINKPQYAYQGIGKNVIRRFKVDKKRLTKLVSGDDSKTDENRVLVVTDNTVVDYEWIVHQCGYDATTEFSKEDAITQHMELPFDVIILDIQNGHEVAEILPDKSSVIGVVENSSARETMGPEYEKVGVKNVILRWEAAEELHNLLWAIKVAGSRSKNKRALAVGNKRAGYKQLLENLGYDATWVPDGGEAIDKHNEDPFGLAILDVDEGPVVADLLKQSEELAIIGVLVDESDANLAQYIEKHVKHFIVREKVALELKKLVTKLETSRMGIADTA